MKLITEHKYLEAYPISPDSDKLIVGTIHPHDTDGFEVPFFYGNVGSLWNIFREAFPQDLKDPKNINDIQDFLKRKKISVSDTIVQCERTSKTALDKDLVPIELNRKIIEDIKNSKITTIFFTSGFKKNNAFRLFYRDILGLQITKEIKENREIILDKSYFGRPVRLVILYSPSGSSNVGISKSKLYLAKKEKYKNSKKPVADFKIDYYRDMFAD